MESLWDAERKHVSQAYINCIVVLIINQLWPHSYKYENLVHGRATTLGMREEPFVQSLHQLEGGLQARPGYFHVIALLLFFRSCSALEQ